MHKIKFQKYKYKFKLNLKLPNLSHLSKDLQKAFRKLDLRAILKFEPALVTSRNATLLVTKLNLFNIAERMNQGIEKGGWHKLEELWKSIGGNPKKLQLAIQMGKKVHDKHHHKFEGYEGFDFEGSNFDEFEGFDYFEGYDCFEGYDLNAFDNYISDSYESEMFDSYVGLADNGLPVVAGGAAAASYPTVQKILDVIKSLGIKVDDVKGLFTKKAEKEVQNSIKEKIETNPEAALKELQSGEPEFKVSSKTNKQIEGNLSDIGGADGKHTPLTDNKNIMLAGAAAVLIVVILATQKK